MKRKPFRLYASYYFALLEPKGRLPLGTLLLKTRAEHFRVAN